MDDQQFVEGLKAKLRPSIDEYLKENPLIEEESSSLNLVPYALLEICVDLMPMDKPYLDEVFSEIVNFYPKQTLN
jgi:hypothetical protein